MNGENRTAKTTWMDFQEFRAEVLSVADALSPGQDRVWNHFGKPSGMNHPVFLTEDAKTCLGTLVGRNRPSATHARSASGATQAAHRMVEAFFSVKLRKVVDAAA